MNSGRMTRCVAGLSSGQRAPPVLDVETVCPRLGSAQREAKRRELAGYVAKEGYERVRAAKRLQVGSPIRTAASDLARPLTALRGRRRTAKARSRDRARHAAAGSAVCERQPRSHPEPPWAAGPCASAPLAIKRLKARGEARVMAPVQGVVSVAEALE